MKSSENKRIENLYFVHILPFDRQTIKSTLKHEKELNRVDDIISILFELWEMTLSAFREVSTLVMMDSIEAIFASRILLIHGYYAQANILLRASLESWVAGLFYDDHPVEWERISEELVEEKVPSFTKEILPYFFKFPAFRELKKHDPKVQERISAYYKDLSTYIHALGIKKTNIKNLKRLKSDIYTKFSKKDLEQFIKNLSILKDFLILFTFLRYYSDFRLYRRKTPELILNLDERYVESLLKVDQEEELFTQKTRTRIIEMLDKKKSMDGERVG